MGLQAVGSVHYGLHNDYTMPMYKNILESLRSIALGKFVSFCVMLRHNESIIDPISIVTHKISRLFV